MVLYAVTNDVLESFTVNINVEAMQLTDFRLYNYGKNSVEVSGGSTPTGGVVEGAKLTLFSDKTNHIYVLPFSNVPVVLKHSILSNVLPYYFKLAEIDVDKDGNPMDVRYAGSGSWRNYNEYAGAEFNYEIVDGYLSSYKLSLTDTKVFVNNTELAVADNLPESTEDPSGGVYESSVLVTYEKERLPLNTKSRASIVYHTAGDDFTLEEGFTVKAILRYEFGFNTDRSIFYANITPLSSNPTYVFTFTTLLLNAEEIE